MNLEQSNERRNRLDFPISVLLIYHSLLIVGECYDPFIR